VQNAKIENNEKLGPIESLINGAGGNHPTGTTKEEQMDENSINHLEDTFYGLEMDGFDKVFALNFKGTLLPTMVFTLDMLKARRGVVLNISSMNSYKPLTKIPAYSAAKASINNFTEWLAVHLAKVGVRVNAIAPGFIITEMTAKIPEEARKQWEASIPMKRGGLPEEVAKVALFLASDLASYVTGQELHVNGGMLM